MKERLCRKKKIVIISAIVCVVLLLVPIPLQVKDGGTMTYNAVLYRIVVWNKIDDTKPDGYKTGTEIHFFPQNFKNSAELL